MFSNNRSPRNGGPLLSRRRFVQGLAAGGALAGLAPGSLLAGTGDRPGPQTLRGTDFHLTIGAEGVNFTGSPGVATAINGTVPAPILRWREGDTVTLRVTNTLPVTSSIHWHGIILPTEMDGVPGISFDGIPPGGTFTYRFPVTQSGTYWYHSHSGFQEQTGMYGAIVIDPREKDPVDYDRDYVVMLSDWTDEDPARVYAKLKKLSHYYNFNERTVGETFRDIREKGVAATWNDRKMWNRMRMSDRDLSDVSGHTYTFLMNGQTPAGGWTGLFRKGEKIRLRLINGAAMTFFDFRIPGLKMKVVAADGQNIEPVTVDEIRLGVAETYDVIVEPDGDTAYTLFAQAIDRSGYARGTLTPDPSLSAPVPEMDPVPLLSHGDMGMDMAGMGHAGHDMGAMPMNHAMPASADKASPMAMDHGMHSTQPAPVMEHGMHSMQPAMAMDHGGHDRSAAASGQPMTSPGRPGMAGHGSANTSVTHAETESGPHVDMRAAAPQYRLNDPGVGLRGNGRRVLTYADLRNLHPTPDPREPGREIELHLTGNMSRYMWSINGVKFADAEPLRLHYGERVRITLVNDTMMNHPMHLHGMWSDLETGDGRRIPRKHTVVVQPGSKISYLVTADAKGGWAYHCHLLFHMLGMFRKVVVA
jgi:CopA family copper-resistance protein